MRQYLTKTSERIFNKLISQLGEDGHIKIDNCEGVFMPIVVEKLGENKHGTIYSLTHYGEQNGDAMKDPDMTFLVRPYGIMPMSFQQDYIPIYQVSAEVGEDGYLRYKPKLLNEHVTFANMWLRNIKAQQGL